MNGITIALISDIHGNSWALDAVLEDINQRGIDQIVNLGDCVYGRPDPAGTAQRFLAHELPTVRGNADRSVLEVDEESTDTVRYTHDQWQVEQVLVPYDWIAAASAARENGHSD